MLITATIRILILTSGKSNTTALQITHGFRQSKSNMIRIMCSDIRRALSWADLGSNQRMQKVPESNCLWENGMAENEIMMGDRPRFLPKLRAWRRRINGGSPLDYS